MSSQQPSYPIIPRAFILIAAFSGLAGVVLAAASAHTGSERLLGGASTMCLAHAPILLVLGLCFNRLKSAAIAGALLIVGTTIFSLDLVSRHFLGQGLFSMAAPTGGVLMMAGWITIALGALWPTNK